MARALLCAATRRQRAHFLQSGTRQAAWLNMAARLPTHLATNGAKCDGTGCGIRRSCRCAACCKLNASAYLRARGDAVHKA